MKRKIKTVGIQSLNKGKSHGMELVPKFKNLVMSVFGAINV